MSLSVGQTASYLPGKHKQASKACMYKHHVQSKASLKQVPYRLPTRHVSKNCLHGRRVVDFPLQPTIEIGMLDAADSIAGHDHHPN